MQDEYIVIFNSANGIGTTQSKTYYFDWSIFENTKYELTTSYFSTTTSNGVSPTFITKLLLYYSDFGVHSNQFTTSNTDMVAQKSSKTFICYGDLSVGAGLTRDSATILNPRTILQNRPTNNAIVIEALDNSGNPYELVSANAVSGLPPDYVMTCRFKKIKE